MCFYLHKSYLYTLLQKQLNSLKQTHIGLDIEDLATEYLLSVNHRPRTGEARKELVIYHREHILGHEQKAQVSCS